MPWPLSASHFERFEPSNRISASEGGRYAELLAEMTEQVRALGPLDWRPQPYPLAEQVHS